MSVPLVWESSKGDLQALGGVDRICIVMTLPSTAVMESPLSVLVNIHRILRMRSAILRLHKFLDFTEHIPLRHAV